MALIWVAITDRPTAHHRICRPARKKSSMRRLPRLIASISGSG